MKQKKSNYKKSSHQVIWIRNTQFRMMFSRGWTTEDFVDISEGLCPRTIQAPVQRPVFSK